MKKIIEIDENTRIQAIKDDFMLQYKQKSKTGRIAWHTDGHYSNLTALSIAYLDSSPYRAIQATEDFKRLIEVINEAETKICNLIINHT